MELKKLTFPKKGEHYLKYIFKKKEEGVTVECGSVFLKKGEILPCRSCYRFLYFDRETEQEAEKATF